MRRTSIVVFALPMVLLASPVMAANEGQIEGGNIYRIQNITAGADFADPANATGCQVLRYRVRIHNPGPGVLSTVTLKAVVLSGAAMSNISTVTISSTNADLASTSNTATVNFDKSLSLSFVPGSTQLLGPNLNVISNLPDGVTSGGINIGVVGFSLQQIRYVQFDEKTPCATPTPTPTPIPTPTPTPVPTPTPPPTPEALPSTGGAAGLAGIAGFATIVSSAMLYRRSRQAVVNSLRNK